MGERAAADLLGVACALGAATIGGVFFAFSSFVMSALARLPAEHGARAMQEINVVVINASFLGVFFGTAALCIVHAGTSLARNAVAGAPLDLLGAALYVVGCFGVTIAANVPLNNVLARVEAPSPRLQATWTGYLRRWTAWNHVRTIAALLAAACFAVSLAA